MLAYLALAVFVGLLIYAACTDIASLTIPNWVSVALAGIFPVLALIGGMPLAQIGIHLLLGFAVLAIGFFLFQANILGGGDAKLLGAAAVWTGPALFITFALWTVLAGGALAVLIITARSFSPALAAWTPAFVNRLLTPKGGMPYGVAIMVGGLMVALELPLVGDALTLL